MNGDNCSLADRCAYKGTFLCTDDAFNGSVGCFHYNNGFGTTKRRKNFEKIEKRWRERVCISLCDNVRSSDGD